MTTNAENAAGLFSLSTVCRLRSDSFDNSLLWLLRVVIIHILFSNSKVSQTVHVYDLRLEIEENR